MAIEYVEIRNANADLIGIIDGAQSVIWHAVYFGVGDFEIYIEATPETVNLLKKGHFVTRPNDIEVGIIESVEIATNSQNGIMITAAGRFAKSILDRRLIYNLSGNSNKATTLYGNVENEVREVVYNNAINCAFDPARNFSMLELGRVANIPLRIIDKNGNAARKQVTFGNLLEYTDGVLEEYGIASTVILDVLSKKFQYTVYNGIDRSVSNADGNAPVVFSQEFDNLTAGVYSYDETAVKNVALIGGEGEGTARFYSLLAGTETDLQRREIFVDASSISKTYTDESETEKTYTDEEYSALLNAQGAQVLAPLKAAESFAGTIDILNGNYVYNRDFSLGDIVTVQDNLIGVYVNVRIREITEVQDENGYTIDAKYS